MARSVSSSRLTPQGFGTAIYSNLTATNKINCGATDFLGTGALTICCWVKVNLDAATTPASRIVDNGKTIFNIGPGSVREGHLRFRSDGAAANIFSANYSIKNGVWQFVAVSRDAAGTCNFYVDGALSGSANQASGTPASGTTNVFVGGSNSSGNELIGTMDSLRIFNRILTVAELTAIYQRNALPTDVPGSLIAQYLFDEGSGTTANDTSGNAHTGTIAGMTYTTDVPMVIRSAAGLRTPVPAGGRSSSV